MKIIGMMAMLLLLVTLSGCAMVSKSNIRQGNTRTVKYGLLGGWIPLYSSTETVEERR